MADIGIIGAGVSSLHLGIRLRNSNVPVTIYAPQEPETIENGRITNSVAHMDDTIRREREMGIEYWDRSNCRVATYRTYNLQMPDGKFEQSKGALGGDERCVDYRVYLPRLMREFIARGGNIIYATPTVANFDELYGSHDLLAIGVGKKHDGFGDFFPQINELTKHEQAQRVLCAGIYNGVTAPDPLSVTFNISVGHGELIELPIETRDGPRTALLMECRFDGDLAPMAELHYREHPDAFNRRALDALAVHFPDVRRRVNKAHFGLMNEKALLQGAVRPITRHAWAEISDRRFAVAIGDLRCTMDPLTGQGANLASFGACALADQITAAQNDFDKDFCERYDAAVRYRVAGVVNFNNALLDPNEHTRKLIHAMPNNVALCNDFSSRFARPETIWFDILQDAATCERYIAKFETSERAA